MVRCHLPPVAEPEPNRMLFPTVPLSKSSKIWTVGPLAPKSLPVIVISEPLVMVPETPVIRGAGVLGQLFGVILQS